MSDPVERAKKVIKLKHLVARFSTEMCNRLDAFCEPTTQRRKNDDDSDDDDDKSVSSNVEEIHAPPPPEKKRERTPEKEESPEKKRERTPEKEESSPEEKKKKRKPAWIPRPDDFHCPGAFWMNPPVKCSGASKRVVNMRVAGEKPGDKQKTIQICQECRKKKPKK